jgi:hypothetical protein
VQWNIIEVFAGFEADIELFFFVLRCLNEVNNTKIAVVTVGLAVEIIRYAAQGAGVFLMQIMARLGWFIFLDAVDKISNNIRDASNMAKMLALNRETLEDFCLVFAEMVDSGLHKKVSFLDLENKVLGLQ